MVLLTVDQNLSSWVNAFKVPRLCSPVRSNVFNGFTGAVMAQLGRPADKLAADIIFDMPGS